MPNPVAAHPIDVRANRMARKYPRSIQVARLAWAVTAPVFAAIPRPFWGMRRAILRAFGAGIGRDVQIYPSARITMPWNLRVGDGAAIGARARLYCLGKVTIGAGATVSQGAHLCAGSHDRHSPDRRLLTPPIEIGPDAWICAEAFVAPGVRIGCNAVLAARAVAFRDVPDGAMAMGNPAQTDKDSDT